MGLDWVKVLMTYGVAMIVILGGGYLLVSGLLPPDDDLTKGAIIGFMGIAINWTFSESTRTSTARQTTRALMTNPTVTTTATPEVVTTTTAAPAPAPESVQEEKDT